MPETSSQAQHVLQELIPLVKSPELWDLSAIEFPEKGNIWVLGAGKASVQMAEAVLEEEFHRVVDGVVISPTEEYLDHIQVFKGSHPYPDVNSVSASYELREVARHIPAGDTVVFCLSGGASSLLTIPPAGIEIDELAQTYKLLLECGAPIHEMNIVRKHLCEVKGGQLASELAHTNLITLLISDVPGDDFSTIGSGPTVPDPSTYEEAVSILKTYSIWDQIPESIQTHFLKGIAGKVPETPKPEVDEHLNHKIYLLNSAQNFAKTISVRLREQGFDTWMAEHAYNTDVKDVVKMICTKAISVLRGDTPLSKPAALVFYGESRVQVEGTMGKGGRNQHIALACAMALEGQHHVTMLSLGTDGIDGPTDAAGALIDSYTTLKARKAHINPEEYLRTFDSYHFHERMGTHIITGPTGNNLMDLQVLIIE